MSRCRPLYISGWALLASALIFNHWLIGNIISADGSLGLKFKLLTWVIQACLIAAGIKCLYASRTVTKAFPWLKNQYLFIAINVCNFILLFIAANVVALAFKSEPKGPSGRMDLYYNPVELYYSDRQKLREVYPGRSDEDIWALINPPSSAANPVIQYMAGPVESPHYTVGFEGVRYDQRVNGKNVKNVINGGTWVFGGSTLFGAGVSNEESIVAHLNAQDKNHYYLNFGFPSYQQNLEIDKLLILLKKGYRPKRVILLDGWNDLNSLCASNFHPTETPAKAQHAYGSVTDIEHFTNPPWPFALRKIPLFDLVLTNLSPPVETLDRPLTAEGYDDIYSADSLYHQDPVAHYRLLSKERYDYEQIMSQMDKYRKKISDYYLLNLKFLDEISEAFEFDCFVFLQPLGSLSPNNPFIRNQKEWEEHLFPKITREMLNAAQKLITSGQAPNFYDISDADADLQASYVDGGHYNDDLCEEIAQRILKVINNNAP